MGSMLIPKIPSPVASRTLLQVCRNAGTVATTTEEPVYPDIKDVSFATRAKKPTIDFANALRSKSSYEEKMIEINMPRKYGWATYIVTPNLEYGSQEFYQKVTRSGMIQTPNLPLHADLPSIDYGGVKSKLIDAIEQELDFIQTRKSSKKSFEEEANFALTQSIASVTTRVLTSMLNVHDIENVEIEENPRSEAFWCVGEFDPSPDVKKFRTKQAPESLRKFLNENDPVHYNFQYIGNPVLQLQSKDPLISTSPQDEGLSREVQVPHWPYQPTKFGVTRHLRYVTNVSATWPTHNDRPFTLLSWLPFSAAYSRSGHNDMKEYTDNLAMLHGFASMSAQAARLGFTHLNHITYPMSTQVVVGDGQYLSFYQYQMNTNVMHPAVMKDDAPYNLCFGTPMLRLYEAVENGQLKGLDDSVLNHLIDAYRVQPQPAKYDLSPYFGEQRYLSDLADPKLKIALDRDFKEMYCNRKQETRKRPEIYQWERIYKLYFNTRPQDARRKWWATGEKILRDRYDDILPRYVPKHLRDPPKKSRRGRSVVKVISA